MKRDEIMEIIVKHTLDVIPELDRNQIDPSAPVSSMDISSLDVIDVITLTSRQMGVRATRTDLAKTESLDDLADLFVALLARKQSEQPADALSEKG
jgi:acyl carrier protein